MASKIGKLESIMEMYESTRPSKFRFASYIREIQALIAENGARIPVSGVKEFDLSGYQEHTKLEDELEKFVDQTKKLKQEAIQFRKELESIIQLCPGLYKGLLSSSSSPKETKQSF